MAYINIRMSFESIKEKKRKLFFRGEGGGGAYNKINWFKIMLKAIEIWDYTVIP